MTCHGRFSDGHGGLFCHQIWQASDQSDVAGAVKGAAGDGNERVAGSGSFVLLPPEGWKAGRIVLLVDESNPLFASATGVVVSLSRSTFTSALLQARPGLLAFLAIPGPHPNCQAAASAGMHCLLAHGIGAELRWVVGRSYVGPYCNINENIANCSHFTAN